ncbi:MAG: ester cyclase [Solirubrobacterales bacterium]
MASLGESERRKREQLVRDHVELENAGDYAAALATFEHPRYEYVATDEVYDGAEEVLDHWEELQRAFPDQLIEIVALHGADDAVLMEAVARGTHSGPLRGLPPTGRRFEQEFLAIFVFEDEGLVCERVYYDAATVLRQLGVARDPLSAGGRLETAVSHPLTIGRGLVRRVIGR